eukprot:GFYU01004247.1.p1 GENE.GFYU01004247.1~~GFYU01004247.1.p1  ORF type:complete len:922 (-),score=245.94 GFYU01004247.1:185-2950(-)
MADSPSPQSVRVFVRFRPPSDREMVEDGSASPETARKLSRIATSSSVYSASNTTLTGKQAFNLTYELPKSVTWTKGESNNTFTVDRVFVPDTTQETVFQEIAEPVVEDVLNGYNGTIFAYGQTGAGKTYTMFGPSQEDGLEGIIPRVGRQIFKAATADSEKVQFSISASYIEIYKEEIRDLLSPEGTEKLRIRECPRRGVIVENMKVENVTTEDDITSLLYIGEKFRVVAATNMNVISSRSHSIFTITIVQKLQDQSTVVSKLNLVDLAGSEKTSKSGTDGKLLSEATKINLSLSALGKCIRCLNENKPHIPYRDSKLTWLLRDSLGGNTKTTLLAACSPHPYNAEETLSTLRFAQRAKSVQNVVKVNKIKSVEDLTLLVESLQKQVFQLKQQNAMNAKDRRSSNASGRGSPRSPSPSTVGMAQRVEAANVLSPRELSPSGRNAMLSVLMDALMLVDRIQGNVEVTQALKGVIRDGVTQLEQMGDNDDTNEKSLTLDDEVGSKIKRVEDVCIRLRQMTALSQLESEACNRYMVELETLLEALVELKTRITDEMLFWSTVESGNEDELKDLELATRSDHDVRTVVVEVEAIHGDLQDALESRGAAYNARRQRLTALKGVVAGLEKQLDVDMTENEEEFTYFLAEADHMLSEEDTVEALSLTDMRSHHTLVTDAKAKISRINAWVHDMDKDKNKLLEHLNHEKHSNRESDASELSSLKDKLAELEEELQQRQLQNESLERRLSQSPVVPRSSLGSTPRRSTTAGGDTCLKCSLCDRLIRVDQLEKHSETCTKTNENDMGALSHNRSLVSLSHELREWIEAIMEEMEDASEGGSRRSSGSGSQGLLLKALRTVRAITESSASLPSTEKDKLEGLRWNLVTTMNGLQLNRLNKDSVERLVGLATTLQDKIKDKISLTSTSEAQSQ